ncbi:MAG TPA: hypothetical protein VE177_00025 [Candidatus Binatus sp.]|nr:hypothetical protein [Candidatus Binatus sp.]
MGGDWPKQAASRSAGRVTGQESENYDDNTRNENDASEDWQEEYDRSLFRSDRTLLFFRLTVFAYQARFTRWTDISSAVLTDIDRGMQATSFTCFAWQITWDSSRINL